jgi:hypothetical protein
MRGRKYKGGGNGTTRKKDTNGNTATLPPIDTSIDNYLDTKRDELQTNGFMTKTNTAMERLKAIDSDFRKMVEEMEQHWLGEANDILKTIMDTIRDRLDDPEKKDTITINELMYMIKVIASEHNLARGKPNTIVGNKSLSNVSEPDLDDRIAKLTKLLESVEGPVYDVTPKS